MREGHAGQESVRFIPARYTVIRYELNKKSSQYLIGLEKGGSRLRNVRQILFMVIIGLISGRSFHRRGCIEA